MAGNKSYPISNLLSLVRTKDNRIFQSCRTCFLENLNLKITVLVVETIEACPSASALIS